MAEQLASLRAEVAALPKETDPAVAEQLASLRAEVAALPKETDPAVAEQLASLRAEVAALPRETDPAVAEQLASLRAAVDDLGNKLDELASAVVIQGGGIEARLEERTATVTQRLDEAAATLSEQQRASRGAISEVLDRTSEATAALQELSSALQRAPVTPGGDQVLDALRQVADSLAAHLRASEAQGAELAALGGGLERVQHVLDRLIGDPTWEGPRTRVDATSSTPVTVELDEAEMAVVADAVAAMLLDASPPPRPPHQLAEPPSTTSTPQPPQPRSRRPAVATTGAPRRRTPPVGDSVPKKRRRQRSEPLQARSRDGREDEPG